MKNKFPIHDIDVLILTSSVTPTAYNNNMTMKQTGDTANPQSKSNPIQLLDEISKLYQQLGELEVESLKIDKSVVVEPKGNMEFPESALAEHLSRRQKLLLKILQLTNEYIHITQHKY